MCRRMSWFPDHWSKWCKSGEYTNFVVLCRNELLHLISFLNRRISLFRLLIFIYASPLTLVGAFLSFHFDHTVILISFGQNGGTALFAEALPDLSVPERGSSFYI